MLFAQRQDIRNASSIIEEVEDVVMNFKSYAEKVEIDEHWIRKIERVLEKSVSKRFHQAIFLAPLLLYLFHVCRIIGSQLLHLLLCCFRQGRYLVSDAEIGNGGS